MLASSVRVEKGDCDGDACRKLDLVDQLDRVAAQSVITAINPSARAVRRERAGRQRAREAVAPRR